MSNYDLLAGFHLANRDASVRPIRHHGVLAYDNRYYRLEGDFNGVVALPTLDLVTFTVRTRSVSPARRRFPKYF